MNLQYLLTKDGLTVILFGKVVTVSQTAKNYAEIVYAVKHGHGEEVVAGLIHKFKNKVLGVIRLTPSLSYDNGIVRWFGEELHGYAVDKLVNMVNDGVDVGPIANFLSKVQANPTPAVVEHLFKFLEYGKMPITPTGDFIAYKAISSDWKDIHSGLFDNNIGKYVQMPRAGVDDDRDVTCSTGFHVCSFDYLPHFSHTNGHVVLCQVNPADVVAIPSDYHNTKMRVSAYKVIDEYAGYYKGYGNVLATKPVWDATYAVFHRDPAGGMPDWELVEDYIDDIEDAKDVAGEVFDDLGGEVKVENDKAVMIAYLKEV